MARDLLSEFYQELKTMFNPMIVHQVNGWIERGNHIVGYSWYYESIAGSDNVNQFEQDIELSLRNGRRNFEKYLSDKSITFSNRQTQCLVDQLADFRFDNCYLKYVELEPIENGKFYEQDAFRHYCLKSNDHETGEQFEYTSSDGILIEAKYANCFKNQLSRHIEALQNSVKSHEKKPLKAAFLLDVSAENLSEMWSDLTLDKIIKCDKQDFIDAFKMTGPKSPIVWLKADNALWYFITTLTENHNISKVWERTALLFSKVDGNKFHSRNLSKRTDFRDSAIKRALDDALSHIITNNSK